MMPLSAFFDERTCKIRHGGFETAALVDHIDDGKAVFLPDAVVVFAEGGRDVYDARAVGQGDIAVAHHIVRLFAVRALRITEERLVFRVFVFLPLFNGKSLAIFKQCRHERLRQNVMRTVFRHDFGIILVGIHAERDVGRERPGGRRPSEKIGIFLSFSLEADKDGRFLDVLISLRHFVRGERRAAAGAIRDDLVPLVKQALFPDLFERPPDGFDVFIVVGDIRVFHICPIADAFGHLFPFALILPDAFLAFFDKRLDAVFFDVLLAVHAEGFFHFQLDGKAVRIPPRLAEDVLALHRLIAGDDVLHDAREDMPDVRLSVRRRGAVVEGELLSPFALFDAVFKDVIFLPKFDDFLFAVDKMHRRVYLFIHRLSPETFFPKEKPSRFRKTKGPPKHTNIRSF